MSHEPSRVLSKICSDDFYLVGGGSPLIEKAREGLWLEGRVLQLQCGGMGGDLPKASWGWTHIWELPINKILTDMN